MYPSILSLTLQSHLPDLNDSLFFIYEFGVMGIWKLKHLWNGFGSENIALQQSYQKLPQEELAEGSRG